VVLTRDAAKTVKGYVNGVQKIEFVDSGDAAVIDANNRLIFFKDDTTEGAPGKVARIRLYDCVLSASEVAALDRSPAPTPTCAFTLASTSTSLPAGGGTGNVSFTATTSSCAWTSSSNTTWLTITSGASGAGNGTVSYSAALNTGSVARSGTITIGGETFTANQAAPAWEAVVLTAGQAEIKTWTTGGRTYAYL
jgi:hypothetical protein